MDPNSGKVYATKEQAVAAGAREDDLVMIDPRTGQTWKAKEIKTEEERRRRAAERAVRMVNSGNKLPKEVVRGRRDAARAKNRVARKSRKRNR